MINFEKVWNEKCKQYGIEKQISIFPKVKRIIVLGDIHGDYNMLISSLRLAKLINMKDNWIGKDTYVVQVGDQIDRCRPDGVSCDKQIIPNDKDEDFKILNYLTILHNQAKRHNGAVISLLGNHELMNVDGNLDYVSMAGLGYLADPNGYFKSKEDRIKQFSLGNNISEFLACTRYVAVIIGSNLFAHAGVVGKIAKEYNVNSINQIMTLFLLNKFDNNKYIYDNISNRTHLLTKNNTDDLFNNSQYSPLWNRIYGYMGYFYENNGLPQKYKSEDEIKKVCAENLDILKDVYQVDKIYVGHTPMLNNGITSVCNGKVWLTDYGSSSAFNKFKKTNLKQAQVLEILNDGEHINILKDSDYDKSFYYKETNTEIDIIKYD